MLMIDQRLRREDIRPALADPGKYAGLQMDRTMNDWVADAICNLLNPPHPKETWADVWSRFDKEKQDGIR